MKQIVFICAMVVTATSAIAQPQHWDENTGRTVQTSAAAPTLHNVEMDTDGKLLKFLQVPEMAQEIKVVITNANGDELMQKCITPEKSSVDIHGLKKDKIYFVTLVCGEKARKAFTLHL